MNASEAKEKVLKVWPDAELVGYFDGAYAIFSRLAHHASTTGYIGWGQTTYKVSSTLASSQAWIDAASRLPEEKEPAPKEGEKWDCEVCGATYGAPGVCEMCFAYSGILRHLVKRSQSKNQKPPAVPAKVESGDALPPLGEFGFEQFNGRSDVWKAIVEIRELQLKASLLREKGLKEEIERLRDELFTQQDINEAYANGKASGKEENERLKGLLERACNVLSSGIVGMPEEVRREARMVVRGRIKAAVTGEQP